MSSRVVKYFLGVLMVSTVTSSAIKAEKQKGCDKACQRECLKVLNKYRTNHDAPELQFSQYLADKAQHWADSGKFGYDMDYRGKYGQLIEWDVKDELPSFTAVIKHWHDKEKYYDFCKGRSTNGETLHDFTQVVWKKAHKAGCGRGTMLGSRYYVVWMDADGIIGTDFTSAFNDYVGAPKQRDLHWFEVTAMSAVGEPLYINCTNTTKPSQQRIRTKSSVSPDEEPAGNAEENEEKVLNDSNNIKGYLHSDLSNVYDEENKEVAHLSNELDFLNETPPLISYDTKDQNKHLQGILKQSYFPKQSEENQQLNGMNEKEDQQPNEGDLKDKQDNSYFTSRGESTGSDTQEPDQQYTYPNDNKPQSEMDIKNNEEDMSFHNSQESSQQYNDMRFMYMDENQNKFAPNKFDFKNRDDFNDADLKIRDESRQSSFKNTHEFNDDKIDVPANQNQLQNQLYAIDEGSGDSESKQQEEFSKSNHSLEKISLESAFSLMDKPKPFAKKHHDSRPLPSTQGESNNNIHEMIGTIMGRVADQNDQDRGTSPKDFNDKIINDHHMQPDMRAELVKVEQLLDTKIKSLTNSNDNPSNSTEGSTMVHDDPNARTAKIWMLGTPLKPSNIHTPKKKKHNNDVEEIKKKVKELWKVHIKGKKNKHKKPNSQPSEGDMYQDDNQEHNAKAESEKPETVEMQDLSQLHGYQYNPMTGQPIEQNQDNGHMGRVGGEWFGGYGGPMGIPQNVINIPPQAINGPSSPFDYAKKYTNDESKSDKTTTDAKTSSVASQVQKEQPSKDGNKADSESSKGNKGLTNIHRTLPFKDFDDILNNPERLQFHKTTDSETLSAHDMHEMLAKTSDIHDKHSEGQPGFFNEDFTTSNALMKEPNDPLLEIPNDQQNTLVHMLFRAKANADSNSNSNTSYQPHPQLSSEQSQGSVKQRPSFEFKVSYEQPTLVSPQTDVGMQHNNHDGTQDPQQNGEPSSINHQHNDHDIQDSQQNREPSLINNHHNDHDTQESQQSLSINNQNNKDTNTKPAINWITSPYVFKQAQGSQPLSGGVMMTTSGRPIKGTYNTNGVHITKGPFAYRPGHAIEMGGPVTMHSQQANIGDVAEHNEQTNIDHSGGNALNSESTSASKQQTNPSTSDSNENEPQTNEQNTASNSTGNKQQNSDKNRNDEKQDRPNPVGKIIPSIFHQPSLLTLLNKASKKKTSNKTEKGNGTTIETDKIWREPKVITRKKKPPKDQNAANNSSEEADTGKTTPEEEQQQKTNVKNQEHKLDSESIEHKNETVSHLKETPSVQNSNEQERINHHGTENMHEQESKASDNPSTSPQGSATVSKENNENDFHKLIGSGGSETQTNLQGGRQSGELLKLLIQNRLGNSGIAAKVALNPWSLHQEGNATPQTTIDLQTLNDKSDKDSQDNIVSTPSTANTQSPRVSKPRMSMANIISTINHALGLDSPESGLKIAAIKLARKPNTTTKPDTALENQDYIVNNPEAIKAPGNSGQQKIPKLGQFWITKAAGMSGPNQASLKHTGCVDSGERCSQWQERGYCSDVRYADFMRTHCKQTCGYCAFPKVELQSEKPAYSFSDGVFFKHDCKDLPAYEFSCPVWKSQGYCQRREKQMRLACRKTCEFCKSDPSSKPSGYNNHGNHSIESSSHQLDIGDVAHAQTEDSADKNVTTAQNKTADQTESTDHTQSGYTATQNQSLSAEQTAYPGLPQQQINPHEQASSNDEQQAIEIARPAHYDTSNTGRKMPASPQIITAQQIEYLQREGDHADNGNAPDEDDILEENVIKTSPEYHHQNIPEQYLVSTIADSDTKTHDYQSKPIMAQIPYSTSPKARLMQNGEIREQEEDGLDGTGHSSEEGLDNNPDKKESLDVVSTKGCDLSCQKECVESINAYRRNHGARPLQLNQDLANHAQAWADTKTYGHSPRSSQTGELIAVGSFYKTVTAAVKAWHDEEKNFDWKTGKSKNGGEIKHFKQLVAKEASLVGCGRTSVNGEPYYIVHMNSNTDDESRDHTGKPKTPDIGWYSSSSPYWKDLQGRGQIPSNIHQRLI